MTAPPASLPSESTELFELPDSVVLGTLISIVSAESLYLVLVVALIFVVNSRSDLVGMLTYIPSIFQKDSSFIYTDCVTNLKLTTSSVTIMCFPLTLLIEIHFPWSDIVKW